MRLSPWYILLVEDDDDDFALTHDLLREARGRTLEIHRALTVASALDILQRDCPDAVLADYHLGAYNGVDLLREAKALGCRSPFILLTGHGNYEVDLAALQAGFADYLVKGELTSGMLERAIRYAIERQRLLIENQQQKELFASILSIDPSAIAVLAGPNLVYQFANPAYRALLPNPEIDPLQHAFLEIWPTEEGKHRQQRLLEVEVTGNPQDIENDIQQYPDGSAHTFSMHLRPLSWNDQPAVVKVLWETTALERMRRLAETAAIEAHQRAAEAEEGKGILDAVMEYIPEGLEIAEGTDAVIRIRSRYAEELSGMANEVIVNSPSNAYLLKFEMYDATGKNPLKPKDHPLMRAVMNGEIIENEEILLVRPDGLRIPTLCNAGPIRDQQGNITGGINAWRDITDRKIFEAKMLEHATHIEAQHYLLKYREQERLQIARDLHDGPIQEMIGVTFTIQEALSQDLSAAVRGYFLELQERIQAQVHELRSLCNELRPPALAPFGLEKALLSHLESFSQTHPNIAISADLDPDGQQLSDDVRLALFRVCQELLNNVVRHAQASTVEIRFRLSIQQATLEVTDDGKGFETPNQWVELARQGHFGLVGIQERVEAVNGVLKIDSKIGNGTCVTVTIPLIE
ncbi:MAG: PAS domain-containing protein [Anaerolineaceae bacterium]|nr:PAS domain-containing protein [Anaerolineaceae bacterium]